MFSRYLAPEMEYRDKEQREDPIIQGEMASNLLYHLHTQKSMDPPKSTDGAGGNAAEHFSSFTSSPG